MQRAEELLVLISRQQTGTAVVMMKGNVDRLAGNQIVVGRDKKTDLRSCFWDGLKLYAGLNFERFLSNP